MYVHIAMVEICHHQKLVDVKMTGNYLLQVYPRLVVTSLRYEDHICCEL